MKLFKKHKEMPSSPFSIENTKFDTMLSLQGKIMSEINKNKTSNNIADYEFKVFSQNGEDGIIQYLINKISIKNETFVEFGVGNYTEANTRFLLMNNNWHGLIIDGSESNMLQVRNSELAWKYDLQIKSDFITTNNINDIITSANINGEIGILSVDIDGNDYWVYDAINCINPQILITEYNSLFGSKAKVTTPYDAEFVRTNKHYSNLYYGASIAALTDLANKKGYDLVGSNSFGNNLFFVRKDCNTLGVSLTPEAAYVRSKFKESKDENGNLTFLSFDDARKLIEDMEVYDVDRNGLVKLKDINV